VRRHQELPPCKIQLVPACSKTDPQLPKAGPVSQAGGASVIMCLRKGKIHCAAAGGERSEKKCERNSPADTEVSEEERGGGAPDAGAEIPLQPVEKIMAKQFVSLQHKEDHVRADTHPAAHGGPHDRAGGHALTEAAAHGEPMQEQAPVRSCGLQRGANTGAACS